jgi:hypothetical protein
VHSPRKVLSCAEFRSEFYANESKRPLESQPDHAKTLINNPAAFATGNVNNVIRRGYVCDHRYRGEGGGTNPRNPLSRQPFPATGSRNP